MATKVIIEKVNTNSVNIIGKTYNSTMYSGDVGSREKIIGQTFVTEDDIEDSMTIRGDANDSVIRKVTKLEKAEVSIQLLNAENIDSGRSLATAVLRGVWTAPGKENPEMDEIFVLKGTNNEALGQIIDIACAMADTDIGRRAMGKWYPVINGKRVIIRLIAEIGKTGKIIAESAPRAVITNSSACLGCDDDNNNCDGLWRL